MKRSGSLIFVFALLALSALLAACGSSDTEEPPPTELSEIPRISVDDLKEKIDGGESIVLIDTRGASSYDVRHIPGAITEPASYEEYSLEQEIILYCA